MSATSGLTRHGVRHWSTILGRNLLLRHSRCCAVALVQEVAGSPVHTQSRLGQVLSDQGQWSGCFSNAAGMGCLLSGRILTLGDAVAVGQACRPSLNAGISCPRRRSRVAFGRSQSGWIGDSRASLWPAVLHCCVSEGICSAKCLKRRVSCWTSEGRFTFLNRHIVLFRKSISIFWPMQ